MNHYLLPTKPEPRRRDDGGWIIYKGPARLEHAEDPERFRHVLVEVVRPDRDEFEPALAYRFAPPPPPPFVEVELDRDFQGCIDRRVPFDPPGLQAQMIGEWVVVLPQSASPETAEPVRLRTNVLSVNLLIPWGQTWEAVLEVVEMFDEVPATSGPAGAPSSGGSAAAPEG